MIKTGRFSEFVHHFVKTINTEQENRNDEMLVNIWLHRVFNKSFAEYKASLEKPETPTKEELVDIVQASFQMMGEFEMEEQTDKG